jgi:hypothetical protein
MAAAWRAVLLGLAAVVALGASRMWRATAQSVELTRAGLTDTTGRMLAPIDQIRSVERGAFAFKPSNGFLVRLKTPQPRGWAPGLWWSLGRSLGVGGVTNRDEGKLMAEVLSEMVRARDAAPDDAG